MGKVRRAIAQGKMGGGRLLGYRRLLVAAAASLGICGLASLLFYNVHISRHLLCDGSDDSKRRGKKAQKALKPGI